MAFGAVLLQITSCAIAIGIIGYLISYRQKLNTLKLSQRCYHLDKLPSITPFIPKFVIFSIIKPRGKPLDYCQLVAPHRLEEVEKNMNKQLMNSSLNRKVHTINASQPANQSMDAEDIEIYEYFSQISVMIDTLQIDPLHLVSYNKLFKTTDFEHIPMCYANAMRSPLTAFILAKDEFPVAPLGLIHVGTEITMHQRLSLKDQYEVSTSLSEIRDTPKGVEIDILSEFYWIDNDERSVMTKLAYQCIDTFLSKSKQKMQKYRQKPQGWREEFDVNHRKNSNNVIVKKEIEIEIRTAIDYAKITGCLDIVCVGLQRKRRVDHMCLLEKCLVEMQETYKKNPTMFIYQYPIKVVCTFNEALGVDTNATLISNYYANTNDYLTFALVSESATSTHVIGSMVPES